MGTGEAGKTGVTPMGKCSKSFRASLLLSPCKKRQRKPRAEACLKQGIKVEDRIWEPWR